jgi:hypothetical protein
MNWVLVIWLASPNNFTIYEKFQSEEMCVNKMATVQTALVQSGSKMKLDCRNRRPGDAFKKNEIVITRYTLR